MDIPGLKFEDWGPVIVKHGSTVHMWTAYGPNFGRTEFPDWRGSLLIGGLSSRALIRVTLSNGEAREAERFGMNKRIRDVEQGPDGAIWLLEDGRRGSGQLMKLTALNTDS